MERCRLSRQSKWGELHTEQESDGISRGECQTSPLSLSAAKAAVTSQAAEAYLLGLGMLMAAKTRK